MASSPGETEEGPAAAVAPSHQQQQHTSRKSGSDSNVVTRLLRDLGSLIASLLRALCFCFFRSRSTPTSSGRRSPAQDPVTFPPTTAPASISDDSHRYINDDSAQSRHPRRDIDLERGASPATGALRQEEKSVGDHDDDASSMAARQYPQQAPAHAVAIPRIPPAMFSNGSVGNKENVRGEGKQQQHQQQPLHQQAQQHQKQLAKGLQSLRIDDSKEQHDELPQTLPLTAATPTTTEGEVKTEGAKEVEVLDPAVEAAKNVHRAFMHEALEMARLALRTNETPVGCVLVYKNRVIAKGMNATNITRNGTRHAELMAITALLSYSPASDTEQGDPSNSADHPHYWGDVDPRDGHVYPYGQKLHPAPRVSRDIISECILYVTVEPCVMCASLLRQMRVKKVYFGAVNDKFGGTGGVFRIHKNSTPVPIPTEPVPRPVDIEVTRPPLAPKAHYVNGQPRDSISSDGGASKHSSVGENGNGGGVSGQQPRQQQQPQPPPTPITAIAEGTVPGAGLEGDGGNVEPGYDVEGGWGRDEAVNLLRQFYVQENGRAPVPRKKEGRAARLAAMMEKEGMSTEGLPFVSKDSKDGDRDSATSGGGAAGVQGEGEGGEGEVEGGEGEVEGVEQGVNGDGGVAVVEPEREEEEDLIVLMPAAPEVEATSREEMSPLRSMRRGGARRRGGDGGGD